MPPRLPPPVPTEEEIRRLIESADPSTPLGARDRAVLELFYGTGIRVGELRMLEVEDIDLVGRLCRIRRGKGGKGRIVPFGPAAAQQLANYIRWVRPGFLHGAYDDGAVAQPVGLAAHRVGDTPPGAPVGAGGGHRAAPDTAWPAPRVRDALARTPCRPAAHPGAARPRLRRDDPDLHARLGQTPTRDAGTLPPTGERSTSRRRRRWIGIQVITSSLLRT